MFSRSNYNGNTDGDEDNGLLQQLRTRRQNAGGNPVSNSYNFTGDDRQFALVSYLGEGSKVKYLSSGGNCMA